MLDWNFAKVAAAMLAIAAIGYGSAAMAQDAAPEPADGYACECPGTASDDGPRTTEGYGPETADDEVQQTDLNLTVDAVKKDLEGWLEQRGNPRLKVGEVKEKDDDTIQADVVTKDNSLVERFAVDRHSGAYRPDNDS